MDIKGILGDEMYAEFILQYLRLYRILFVNMPFPMVFDAYSRIGVNQKTIRKAFHSAELSLLIKKEFVALCASMLVCSNGSNVEARLCLPVEVRPTSLKFFDFYSGKEEVIEMLLQLWQNQLQSFLKQNSFDDLRFIVSLLENSCVLAKEGLFGL